MPSNLTHRYFTYILTNRRRNLYVGYTNNLQRRIYQHKRGLRQGFSKRHNITSLAYYEETADVLSALAREKQLKGWRRNKKIALIESLNPEWNDLAQDWFDDS